MDEELFLVIDDDLLGVPSGMGGGGTFPSTPSPKRRGGLSRRGAPRRGWAPKEEDEDQYIFRMQLEAIQRPISLKAERDAAKGRSLAGLERGRKAQEMDRFFSPPEGPRMTQADRKTLEERSVLKKAEASLRKKEEDEATKKQIAMNIRMAKVRAAKRKPKKAR